MSTDDDPTEPDGAVQARFAALFQTFFEPNQTDAGRDETAFLAGRLQTRRGGRLICCDRSIVSYGRGLTAEGCSISVFAGADSQGTFDGAIWSLDELGDPPNAVVLAKLAKSLAPGGRLVIDAGEAVLVNVPDIETLTPLGMAQSPSNRRLYTWVREP
jgi:hypothetical protein